MFFSPQKPIVLVIPCVGGKKTCAESAAAETKRRPDSRRQHLHPDGTHSADPLCPTRSESSCFCRRLRDPMMSREPSRNPMNSTPERKRRSLKRYRYGVSGFHPKRPTGLATKTHLIKRICFFSFGQLVVSSFFILEDPWN